MKACINKNTGEKLAVKIVRTNDIEILKAVKNEFLIQKQLTHERIVKVFEMYYDPLKSRMSLIMERVSGSELFVSICKNGPFTEIIAQILFHQLLSGIKYLHDHGLCHRDLKPHNLILTNSLESSKPSLKIADFNVSKFFTSTLSGKKSMIKMTTHTGTKCFSAPETFLQTEYNEKIDIWSAGAILYTMLAGYQPFDNDK